MNNIDTLQNYGLDLSQIIEDTAYFFGLSPVPKIVIQPDRNWGPYLPVYEPQFGGGWDTDGCSVWGTENCIETYLKRLTGKDYNYSERFNYILAGVKPRIGANPHMVAESIRRAGLIPQAELPMTQTYEEFITPDPMTQKFIDEGRRFPFKFQHEFVWNGSISKENRTALIREALQYSPLGVTVTAWFEENGVYVDRGLPNSHWCELFAEAPNGWLIFDSYDQSIKTLSFDHNIQMCKRYYLTPDNRTVIQKLMDLFPSLFAFLKKKV